MALAPQGSQSLSTPRGLRDLVPLLPLWYHFLTFNHSALFDLWPSQADAFTVPWTGQILFPLRVFASAVPSAWNALPFQAFAWLVVSFLEVSAHIPHPLKGLPYLCQHPLLSLCPLGALIPLHSVHDPCRIISLLPVSYLCFPFLHSELHESRNFVCCGFHCCINGPRRVGDIVDRQEYWLVRCLLFPLHGTCVGHLLPAQFCPLSWFPLLLWWLLSDPPKVPLPFLIPQCWWSLGWDLSPLFFSFHTPPTPSPGVDFSANPLLGLVHTQTQMTNKQISVSILDLSPEFQRCLSSRPLDIPT